MPDDYRKPAVSERVGLLVEVLSQQYGPNRKTRWTPAVIQGGLAEDTANEPAEPTE